MPPDSSWKMPIVSPRLQQLERVLIVERDLADHELRLALADQRDRVLDHGQRLQAEEVHLQHAEVGERTHGKLADRRPFLCCRG